MKLNLRISLVLLSLFIVSPVFAQPPAQDSPRIKLIQKLESILLQSDDPSNDRLKDLVNPESFDQLKNGIAEARKLVKQVEVSDILLESKTDGKLVYELPAKIVTVTFGLTENAPFRINKISTEERTEERIEPITWETLESTLDQAARDGFEGAVLITRNGKTVINKAYGYANREKKVKNRSDTIFAIGSAPIDFTHAGILLLKDQGKLKLDDPITKFFDNVPEDKQEITIQHLMRGQSGLRDFHDIAGDENPDHTWIDRDEAVKRILAHKLLFAPGEGRRHSHSAWGLLAAIIEVVSNETYPQFTKTRLFQPAGMTSTGFFGDPIAEDNVAVGYGFRKSSTPNSPPHWGKTSWLVMGSGGQVSTLGDMLRWEVAMREGKILSEESTKLYLRQGDGVSQDGDMFGFEFMHSRDPQQLFMLISNAVDSRETRQTFDALGRRINALVRSSKFSLGIAMAVDADGSVAIQRVVEGSAADKSGLKVGDQLVSANGESMSENPMVVLAPYLKTGQPIEFEIVRNNLSQKIEVKPTRND